MEQLHTDRRVTLVMVTHDAHLAAKAQRQIVLKDGRVISDSDNE